MSDVPVVTQINALPVYDFFICLSIWWVTRENEFMENALLDETIKIDEIFATSREEYFVCQLTCVHLTLFRTLEFFLPLSLLFAICKVQSVVKTLAFKCYIDIWIISVLETRPVILYTEFIFFFLVFTVTTELPQLHIVQTMLYVQSFINQQITANITNLYNTIVHS